MKKFSLLLALSLSYPAHTEQAPACQPTKAYKDVLSNPSLAELKKHIKGKKTVVVDVYASWCGPCKIMLPIVDALAQDTDLDVLFIKVPYDNKELLKHLAQYLPEGKTNISSVPYFFIFRDGKAVDQFNGSMTKVSFKDRIKKNINS